jgi:signal peptidase
VTTEQPQPGQTRLHRWATRGSIAALVVALVLAALMVLPSLFGYLRYVIVSGSMEPTIPTGSVVYDEVVPVADLKVGDIITFVPPPEYAITDHVTHRIVEISVAAEGSSAAGERVFQTQGDANEHRDAWQMVLDGDEQARVRHHLPYVGYVYMFLSNRWVQLLLIGLPALAIMVLLGIALWRLSGDAVLEERAADSGAQERTPTGSGP